MSKFAYCPTPEFCGPPNYSLKYMNRLRGFFKTLILFSFLLPLMREKMTHYQIFQTGITHIILYY